MVPQLLLYALLIAGFNAARLGFRTPRPGLRATLVGAGLLTVVVAAFWAGRDLHRASDVLRYGLSAVAVVAASHVIVGRKPVQCALSLLVVFLCMAGLFVAHQAEFLGAIEVSINAGAVVVSFLFILMLIDLRLDSSRDLARPQSAAALALAGIVVAVILVGVASSRPADSPPKTWFVQAASEPFAPDIHPTRLGEPAEDELAAVEAARLDPSGARPYRLRPITGYTADVGWELYTRYTVPFEVASLILTIAVVGAVAIGRQGGAGEAPGGI